VSISFLSFTDALTMTFQTTGIALVAVVYFIIKYLNKTDYPKIKGIPEIPGVPIFGNLLQFGDSHAKIAGKLAKKFGPVFQVRLGNRVSSFR
jgi:phenylacetate 2-hydroxylase